MTHEVPLLRFEQRVARLERELEDELGLSIGGDALDELAFARFIEPHEGRKPTYGAIVWNNQLDPLLGGVPTLPSPAGLVKVDAPLEVLRRFADGRSVFVIRGAGVRPALAIDPAWTGAESVMSAYSSSEGVTVIQRLASGRVRMYVDDRVYSEEGGLWLNRPSAKVYLDLLTHELPEDLHAIASALLDLCVHSLSPSGIGATLVWSIGDELESVNRPGSDGDSGYWFPTPMGPVCWAA